MSRDRADIERPDGDLPDWWRPPRGYSWDQFEVGNRASLRHGAFSPRTWAPIAQALAAGVVETYPDLARHPELLRSWADAEARAELIRRHLDEVGMLNDEGEPRQGLLQWLSRLDGSAQRYRTELGLTPRSEAELARLRADAVHAVADLDAAAEAGAAVLAQRRAELAEGDDHRPGAA